ncbi:hypothetical protein [Clostridium pasteurianum]|uniref:Uncharacterized protein n=1 Tax=Clostridium pasteurianum BC1 TaxID=86416 RepID=R4JYW1_CLOPA|nr:hypothetical protein [Clostridium pasteurianum]AGK95483.1 hypothetical protein Clopa_0424 [Clostridium pasteurianum BC1]
MKSILQKLSKYRWITICVTVLLLLIRIFLQKIAKSKGLYLSHDYIYNIINYIILAMALSVYFTNKKVRWVYSAIILILLIINTIGIYKSIDNVQFQLTFTHEENSFIVKEIKNDSKFILVYKKQYKIFTRLSDKIAIGNGYKPFSNKTYKVIWINNDKAILKFLYGEALKPKVEILNFSKNNKEYFNVLGSLQGTWTDKNNKDNSITFNGREISYRNSKEVYWYSSSDSDEQGNYGSVLYAHNDDPSIYILKNEDNTITVGYADINNDTWSIYSK